MGLHLLRRQHLRPRGQSKQQGQDQEAQHRQHEGQDM